MKIRGILFDFDGTLGDSWGAHDASWPGVLDVVRRYVPAIDAEAFAERYVEVGERHYDLLLAHGLPFDQYRRARLTEALAPWHELDDDLFDDYRVAKQRAVELLEPFPDAVETLRALRSRGIRVGVLTNGPSDLQRRKLELTGLVPELDAVAISAEIGASKPDARAFEAALRLLGTSAGETAMVGDDLEKDVVGALAAGLAAVVWVERGRRPGERPDGAYLARQIADVPGLLGLLD